MNSLQHTNHTSLTTLIHNAVSLNVITSLRADELYAESEKLTKKLVSYLNHRSSSSLSSLSLIRIMDTVNYLVMHGFDSYDAGYACLKNTGIYTLYEKGKEVVEKDVCTIIYILDQLRAAPVFLENERYQSILEIQINEYLQTLQGYYQIFHYCQTKEDLDYPLADGLPLYHDMYGLQGTDCVLYYLKQLAVENEFCLFFIDQIPAFIHDYEQCKGISIELLGVNLFELLLHQLTAHLLLYNSCGILLEEQDIFSLKNMLRRENDLKQSIDLALSYCLQFFSCDVQNYILLQKEKTILSFQGFLKDDLELFAYSFNKSQHPVILLDNTVSNHDFLYHLHRIQEFKKLQDKILFLKNSSLSVFDLFDLLENSIFMDQEYNALFEAFSAEELAIMLLSLNSELSAFHQKLQLNESLYKELDVSVEWQYYLIEFLRSLSESKKKEIEEHLNRIQVKRS